MQSDHVLLQILKRLEAADPDALLFRAEEVCRWPAELFAALLDSGLIKRASPTGVTECDGCEESCLMPVNVLPATGNRPAKFFISCDKLEDVGRVAVDPTSLRQFRIDSTEVARQLARLFGSERSAVEIFPDRVFHLANAALSRKRRALFLVRGATWQDARDLLDILFAEFEKYPAPLILVPDELPAPGERRQYEFVSVAPMLQLSRKGLTLDHIEFSRHIAKSLGPQGWEIVPFSVPAGIEWEELTVSFVNELTVKIACRDSTEHRTFVEMGFMDSRKSEETPDQLWGILRALAKYKGDISWDESSASFSDPKQLKKWISEIRKKLKMVFPGILGDPFRPYKQVKAYQTRFVLNLSPSAD
jgi:hypothetical protein